MNFKSNPSKVFHSCTQCNKNKITFFFKFIESIVTSYIPQFYFQVVAEPIFFTKSTLSISTMKNWHA